MKVLVAPAALLGGRVPAQCAAPGTGLTVPDPTAKPPPTQHTACQGPAAWSLPPVQSRPLHSATAEARIWWHQSGIQ